jgi:hypothetical protein
MSSVDIPQQRPLTQAQRTQLVADCRAAVDARQPNYPDNIEIWSVIDALLYLVENPTPPPPESEPPPESP